MERAVEWGLDAEDEPHRVVATRGSWRVAVGASGGGGRRSLPRLPFRTYRDDVGREGSPSSPDTKPSEIVEESPSKSAELLTRYEEAQNSIVPHRQQRHVQLRLVLR